MPQTTECPACGEDMRLPDDSAGKNVKCRGCEAILSIRNDDDGGLRLVERKPPPRQAAPESSRACPGCGEAVAPGDKFCGHCGADLEAEARKAESRASTARRREFRAGRRRRSRIMSAGRWLLVLAGAFVVFGTIGGLQASAEAGKAYDELSRHDDGEMLVIEGDVMTVAEVRDEIELEVTLVYGINYLLGAIMVGLYFWSRSSPFPAMLTGLCVYLVVIVLNAVVDPVTLLQGWIWKILFISALVGGMQAALAERLASQRAGTHARRR